jgi:hypothetical protein
MSHGDGHVNGAVRAGEEAAQRPVLSAEADVGDAPISRRAFLRRLTRNGLTVEIPAGYSRRVVITSATGAAVNVPAGALSPRQVEALLDAVGLDVSAYLEMR